MVISNNLKLNQKKHNPNGWTIKKIKDIAPLQRGFDLPTKKIIKGKYPVIYSNGILNFHNSFKVKGNGVITGRSGTIGKVIFVNENFWPHNTTLWVTDFKKNHPRLIYYLYIFLKLQKFATGSGVPTLNRNDVHDFEILISQNYEEQSSIVEKLVTIDQLIQKLNKYIIKKKNIKQGIMQELLTGKIRLLNYKKDWRSDIIDNCAKITTGKKDTQDKIDNGVYPFFVRSKDIEKINTYSYDGEAVLTAGDGEIGKIFHYINGKFDFHQRVYKISDFDNKLDGYFFYLYFSHNFLNRVMAMTAKSTVNSIRMDMISDMEIPLPEKKEQIAIGEIVKDINSDIEKLEEKRDKYIMIKNGMMQKLLTGEIRLV